MGLFTKKFTEDDGVTTAAKWRKTGVIEENLRDLANRIRAGESKGYVSDLYRYKGGVYVPLKFEEVNLQDIYDKVKDGWESLERSIALEKDLHRRTTEIIDSVFNDGLNLDLDDDDDDGNASKFDLDDEVAKLEAELEEVLKEDVVDSPTEAELKNRKEIFIKLNPTLDEMKLQINKIEELIKEKGPDSYARVKDGSMWKLKYLLQVAKEAYAEATEISSDNNDDDDFDLNFDLDDDDFNLNDDDETEDNDDTDNLEKELEKIKKLFEKGLIDESDYKAKKNKLLGI